jgi:hypothetical protein
MLPEERLTHSVLICPRVYYAVDWSEAHGEPLSAITRRQQMKITSATQEADIRRTTIQS